MIRKFTNILKPPVVTPFVKLSEVGSAGVITLDRKDAMNALSYEMVIACYEAFKDLEGRKKLVIIKSSSDKVFSAGGDIKELSASSVERVKHALGTGYRGCHLIHTYKIPFIALINGTAVGAASIFTMGAKYRVSTEKTIFRMPETQFGFFNDSCASYFLSRLERNVGIYLGLTGAPMDGYDVKRFGLSTHYVDSKYLRELEKCLTICDTHDDVLNCLDEFAPSRSNYESKLDENLDRIEKCFSGLTVQQIIDNLKHDGSEWALDTIKTLRRMSPTSLKVCHRLLNMGRYMSVEDCARLEWRLAAHFATKSDLQEGVRALMSDKDKKPKWNPATIEEVSDGDIGRFFGPLHDGDELKFEIKRSSEGFYVA